MEKLKNKTVLIVDDEERNTFALRSYLETFDINIEIATNGQDAIDMLLRGSKADIVLLDMMMPVLDGYETLAILKQHHKFKKLPVIAVTAKAMKGDKEKCLESGAWDYVSKPIDLTVLIDKMSQWIP
jgi:CheY-like chemotaxis protein